MKKEKFEPDYAVHPGLTLKEKLSELGMSEEEFAAKIKETESTVKEIVACKRDITPKIAAEFETVLKIPAAFWLSKQANYDRKKAEEKNSQKEA